MRKHGTYACYAWGPEPGQGKGCRCELCREANRDYERQRSRRVTPAYVSAARARRHVEELRAAGVGLKTIAAAAGVSHSSLAKLVYGDKARGQGPSKRIRKSTEDAILAVSPMRASDGARIPADQYRADLDELRSRGWAYSAVARAIGVSPSNLNPRAEVVTAKKARAVHALLDQPVPEPLTRTGLGAAAARARDAWDPDTEARDEARRAAEAERRARYRNPDPVPTIDPAVFDEPWRKRAACRLLAPEDRWIFWPGRGDFRTVQAAKAVCATCPVSAECLAYALEAGELGVWGGTSEIQRRRMRRAVRVDNTREVV